MRALILVDDAPNDATAAVLEDLGLGEAVGAGWPRADLDCAGGQVRVRCDNWSLLASSLEGREKRSVEAFYLGNLDDLESAHGRQVGYRGWIYEIRRVEEASDDSPYAHRMLTFTRVGAGP